MNTPNNNKTKNRMSIVRHPQWFRVLSAPVLTSAALLALMPVAARSDEASAAKHDPDSFSFSARAGFNISARFKNPGRMNFSSGRTTPDGAKYNYDDGYVFQDSTGDEGGLTSNWGYDNSATQISGNNILLSKTTSAAGLSSPSLDTDPAIGGELVYRHEIGNCAKLRDMRFGFEIAGSLVNVRLNDHSSYGGSVTRQTDAYPFTPGTTPPEATPDQPFQGSFGGPNFLLGDTPVSTTFSTAPGVISGTRKIDTDMWGWRLGPYAEIPVAKRINLSLSGGFAGALLDVGASWNETLSVGSSQYHSIGSGRDHEWRMGYYLAGGADYAFAEKWSLVGSVQYQSLANYEHTISGRSVGIDLSSSVFVTLGLSYRF